MPQIREYQPRANVQGPIALPGRKAEIAGSNVSSGLEDLAAGVDRLGGAVQKRMDQKDTLSAATQLAQASAEMTNDWRERLRTADPNDDQLSPKFMQDFDDKMASIGDTLTTRAGRDYFERNVANVRAGFQETTVAGQSALAGEAMTTNYHSIINSYSSSVMDHPDQLGVALKAHNDAVDTLGQNGLSTKAVMELKAQGSQQITTAAIQGWIKVNPEETRQRLQSGEWDGLINGQTKEVLYRNVDQQINANEIQKKKLEADQQKALLAQQQATQDDFLQKLQDGKLTPKDILNSNLDATGGGSKEHFLDRLNQEVNKPIKTNPGIRNDLLRRINLPDGDPNKITSEAQLNRYFPNLANSDIRFLREEVRQTGTEQGKRENALKSQVMKMATDRLTKGPGIQDPRGQEQLLMFQQAYYDAIDQGRKQGKSITELTSPDFVNPIIQRFERSPQDKLQDRINAFSGASSDANKRKPGESAADYLKRTGH